jgi:predicted enzyme related to lactoylglutathione lyase
VSSASEIPASMAFQRAMTVLDVADMARAVAFYRDTLGFDASTFGDPPGFAILQRGTVTLGLALKDKPCVKPCPQWVTYIYVTNADAILSELQGRGVQVVEPIVDKFYNCRDFTIQDPDGHCLAIGHVLTPDPWGPGLAARPGRDGGKVASGSR